MLRRIEDCITQGPAAVCGLAALGAYAVFLSSIALLPPQWFPFADFLAEFRFRCFNFSGAEGSFPWRYAVQMILEPVLVMSIIALIWRRPCRDYLKFPRRAVVPVTLGLLMATAAMSGLFLIRGDLPAVPQATTEQTASWRSALPTRDFTLTAHDGRSVTLSEMKGNVVLLTAIYSTCRGTCPMILTEIKKTIDALPADVREKVRVLALTLDPENDDQSTRAGVMKQYHMPAPAFSFLNGDLPEMLELLQYYQFGRMKMEGVEDIGHANLFILIDREGLIAHRFALGSPHKDRMPQVLTDLVREVP